MFIKIIPEKVKFLILKGVKADKVYILPCDSEKWTKSIRDNQEMLFHRRFKDLGEENFEVVEINNTGFTLSLVKTEHDRCDRTYISGCAIIVKLHHKDLEKYGYNFYTYVYENELMDLIAKAGNIVGNVIQGTFCFNHVSCQSGRKTSSFIMEDATDIEQTRGRKLGNLMRAAKKTIVKKPGHVYLTAEGTPALYLGVLSNFIDIDTHYYRFRMGFNLFSELGRYGSLSIKSKSHDKKFHLFAYNFWEYEHLIKDSSNWNEVKETIIKDYLINDDTPGIQLLILPDTDFKKRLFLDAGEIYKVDNPELSDTIISLATDIFERTGNGKFISAVNYSSLSESGKKSYEDFLRQVLKNVKTYNKGAKDLIIEFLGLGSSAKSNYCYRDICSCQSLNEECFKKIIKEEFNITY